jgi:putative ABC transport system permease protein
MTMTFLRDVRFGLRMLARHRAHGIAAVGVVALGLAAGAAGARLLTRFIASLLFNITATDAATFVAVGVLLAAIALIATALPALRAVRGDPMLALRAD